MAKNLLNAFPFPDVVYYEILAAQSSICSGCYCSGIITSASVCTGPCLQNGLTAVYDVSTGLESMPVDVKGILLISIALEAPEALQHEMA